MTDPAPPLTAGLSVRGLSRRFGATLALDGVDFDLAPGEIHALLGENGAGKSTLMNLLRGLLAPSFGQIFSDGRPARFRSPEDAARAGVGMVHQHFLLVPAFTVAENLALASRDPRPQTSEAADLCRRLGWTIPFKARVADLPVGTQQRVEILKALLGHAQFLLFDEPTAVLTPPEADELFTVLRALRAEGKSLVFVSHKLGEVLALCDRVTVLRRGRAVGTVAVGETDTEDLARRMVGASLAGKAVAGGGSGTGSAGLLWSESRSATEDSALGLSSVPEALSFKSRPALPVPDTDSTPGVPSVPGIPPAPRVPILAVTGLSTQAGPDAVALRDITFTLAPGETLGVAGVDGNGQAELAGALCGLRPWTQGAVEVNGRTITRLRPRDLARLGIALIPPDRHTEGLALSLSVADNLTLEAARLPRFRRGPGGLLLDRRDLQAFASDLARDYDVRAADLDIPARLLSGGNQQKIVIARALWRKPSLLVAVSPTRGLDVGATAYVHARLRARQTEGGATVLLSTELDEIYALSTRIAVLYEGRIMGIVPADTPREAVGLMMGGRAGA